MAFAEDLAPFFSLNEFAVTASFAGGQARVIFEQPYSSQFGGAVDSEQPMCLAPSADIAAGCEGSAIGDFMLLPDLIGHLGSLGYDVVEMVLADQEGWDRYEAAKWLTMRRWLEANPNDDFAGEVRAYLTHGPKRYVTYTREYLGWGVFALMAR